MGLEQEVVTRVAHRGGYIYGGMAISNSAPSGWSRLRSLIVSAVVAVVLIGAVSTGIVAASHSKRPVVPKVEISVPTVSGKVSPQATIGIALKHAKVRQVSVTTAAGATVAGELVAAGWKPAAPLPWATKFKLTLHANGGTPARMVEQTATWATGPAPLPTETVGLTVSPENGAGVGMGATWVVEFGRPIPASLQSAIVQRLTTAESIPDTVGWHWWSSTEVDGRPETFWPMNEQESLTINLNGLVMDGYQIVDSVATDHFSVVNQYLTKVSGVTHEMQDYDGATLLNTLPVSLGKSGFPTISGTLVVLSKTPVVYMDSASIGYPGLYAEDVYNDVAISTDGYYMHSANWDVGDHGVANVSHGCIEQNPANAIWFYNWSIPGDVVEVTGTVLAATEVNGEGDWNIPWSDYQAN
jgi:lipoprotein-anchoring transpeptidase ErfK/SrfK